ncbi:transcription factor DIVARICATA-like isoform X2 [Apium graveolens]
MEILSPFSYVPRSSWLLEESKSTRWTNEENKLFENALAKFDKDTPDRWQKVAAMVPGKTVADVMRQYKELEDDVSSIEAGLIPIPGYSQSTFTLEWGNSTHGFDGFTTSFGANGKRSSGNRPSDQERKKGVPWTEEEHKLFLLGLKKYGKGDWRNISRNYVVSRTPTQVASHAQKYFIRQHSGGKDKRRASIHDITTVNLNDNQSLSPEIKRPSMDPYNMLCQQKNSTVMPGTPYQWNQPSYGAAAMAFNHTSEKMFMSPYGDSHGIKVEDHDFQMESIHEPYLGSQDMVFQMQSGMHYPHS